MARSRKSLNVKNLKKSNDRYKDTKTGLEFTKKGNNYQMVVNKQAQKQHQANLKRLQALNKKHGGAFNKEIRQEKENWNDYKKAINQFNKGETKRPTTVKKELNYFTEHSQKQAKILSNEKSISSIVSDKKKVQIMRMTGKHGIYNGKAYDDYVKGFADEMNISKEDAEQYLFPTNDNNEIKYEDIQNFLNGNNKMKTGLDLIKEQEQTGEISEEKAIRMTNYIMVGE